MTSNLEQQLREANETIAKMKFAIDFIKPSVADGHEIEFCNYCDLPFPSGFCMWGWCSDCGDGEDDSCFTVICFPCRKQFGRDLGCRNCNKLIELKRDCERCLFKHPEDKELTECPVCRFPWK